MARAGFGWAMSVMAVGGLIACGQAEQEPLETRSVVPDERLITSPERDPLPALPQPVIETRDEILAAADARSLRTLARIADRQAAFLSNLGNDGHYDHWRLMRSTGFDVLRELEDLFAEPHGVKQVGSERWYIWPDLASLDGEALDLERLSFRDRARLKDMIGEVGIAVIQSGDPYPGIQTAISEDGGWRYFLHENGLEDSDNG